MQLPVNINWDLSKVKSGALSDAACTKKAQYASFTPADEYTCISDTVLPYVVAAEQQLAKCMGQHDQLRPAADFCKLVQEKLACSYCRL